MKVTITSIELKSPFHFFALSLRALRIINQLRNTPGIVDKKTTGFWTMHYTMTLWDEEKSLRNFAKTAAHLEAMKISKDIAKEIRTLTCDAESLPTWKVAKADLKAKGRVQIY
jgi:hypothetical protein